MCRVCTCVYLFVLSPSLSSLSPPPSPLSTSAHCRALLKCFLHFPFLVAEADGQAGALRGWDPGPHGGAGAALSQQGWPMPLPVPCPAEPPVCTPQVPNPPQTPSPRGPPPFRFEEKWTDSLRSAPKLVKTYFWPAAMDCSTPPTPSPKFGGYRKGVGGGLQVHSTPSA